MSITAIAYLLTVLSGYIFSIWKDPLWGLLIYFLVYFISPSPEFHWWGNDLPQLRWSLISFVVLLVSCVLHRDKLSDIRLTSVVSVQLLCLFVLWSLFVSFFAVDPNRSFARVYDFFRYVVIFCVIIKCIKTQEQLILILRMFLFFGLILGYEAYNGDRISGRLEGIGTVDSASANGFALLISTICPLAFSFFFQKKKRVWFLTILSLAFMSNAIILANSRGAMLSLMFGFFAIFLFSSIKVKRQLTLLGILGVCGFIYLTDAVFWERFQTTTQISENRGAGRLDIWKNGFRIFTDHPLGVGGDGFRRLSPQYMPVELLSNTGERVPHNTYLLVATEQGVVGILIYSLFLLSLIFLLKKAMSRVKNDNLQQYIICMSLFGALVCHACGSMFGDRLYYEFFYYIAALCVISNHLSIQKNE